MTTVAPDSSPGPRRDSRRAAGVAFGAHGLHDGFTDMIYVLLPVWQAEFGLSYAALGLLRGLFSGAMAGLQLPAGHLAERFGIPIVLALGTLIIGAGFVLAGLSGGLLTLMLALLLGGVGSSTQHPLASNLIVQAFPGGRSRAALGTYNFAGDIGKMAVPFLASLLMVSLPWRDTVILLGGCGILAAVAVFVVTPRYPADVAMPARKDDTRGRVRAGRFSFPILFSIGVLDSATRMAFLTFLPFVLTAKGASLPTVGAALTLVFAGGAFGKITCAFLGARIGAVHTVWLTEIVTAIGVAAVLPLPLEAAMVLLPFVGIALNGTSSVLYGSVPDLVEPHRRMRAFSIFYTGTIGAGAISPVIFGLFSDRLGIPGSMLLVAAMALLTLPLVAGLRGVLPRSG